MRIALGALFLLLSFQLQAEDAIDNRIDKENWDSYSPFTLMAHESNYLMPFTYADGYASILNRDGETARADYIEAKFQLSFKAPLWSRIFKDNGYLFFAFTQQAYWQAYNRDVSSPFRETNYEPEFILAFPHNRGDDSAISRVISLSLSHQSNGRAGELSRSWNRLKASWLLSLGDVYINFEPWYRFEEPKKEFPGDPQGDDNPDIEKYLGWFELTTVYKYQESTWQLMMRHNLRSESYGAVKLSYSRPFNKHLRLYAELFSGYGESLIDYNRSVTRFGIGFELNNIL